MTRTAAFIILWLGCCLYALVRGGVPEKIGASIFLVAAVASAVVVQMDGTRFEHVETGMLIVDCAVFASFFCLALASNRFWPIWMSAMQAVQLFSHFAIVLSPDVIPWGYWNAQTLWSYPMLILLACASAHNHSRGPQNRNNGYWRRSL